MWPAAATLDSTARGQPTVSEFYWPGLLLCPLAGGRNPAISYVSPGTPNRWARPGRLVQLRDSSRTRTIGLEGFSPGLCSLCLPRRSLHDAGQLHPFFLVLPASLDSWGLQVQWGLSGAPPGLTQARLSPRSALTLHLPLILWSSPFPRLCPVAVPPPFTHGPQAGPALGQMEPLGPSGPPLLYPVPAFPLRIY